MRVAIVGCGQIAPLHASTLGTLPDVEVVAVCDRDEQRARGAAVWSPGARPYTDLAALLANERPEVVHVLTPPASHAAVAIQAMDAGCHVLVEKPMALSVNEADRMLAAARRNGVKLCTNHNYRYKPSVLRARQLMASGAIGQVRHVDAYYGLADERGDFEGSGGGHWAQRLPGGIFTNFLPHLIYLEATFLDLDECNAVAGVALGHANGPGEPATELSVLLQGRDATGSMTFSTSAKPYAKFVDVYGTRGIIHCDLVREVCTIYRNRRVPRLIGKALFNVEGSAQLVSGTAVNTAKVALGRMKNMPELPVIFGEFYASIRQDREPPAPGEEGRRMVSVMEQIWRKAPALSASPSQSRSSLRSNAYSSPLTPVEGRLRQSGELSGKVLVTGAAGFLGRHLVASLHRCGADVVALVRDKSRVTPELEAQARIVEGNLCDAAALASAMEGVSVVFHCAGATKNNLSWAVHEETNIAGTRQVFLQALKSGVSRVVHVSSVIVYGFDEPRGGGLIDESTPYAQVRDPWAHYLRSKVEADKLALEMYRRDKLPVTVIRPGVIYGPGGRPVAQGLAQFGSVRLVVGKAQNKLPFTFVQNTVDALLLAAVTRDAVGQAYNVVDELPMTVRDCALAQAALSQDPVHLLPVPPVLLHAAAGALELKRSRAGSDVPPRLSRFVVRSACCDLRYSTEKAKRELGWEPAVPLQEGLRRQIASVDGAGPVSVAQR